MKDDPQTDEPTMTSAGARLAALASAMVTRWLTERGLAASGGGTTVGSPAPLARLTVEGRTLCLAVLPLFEDAAEGEPGRRRVDLEHQLSAAGAGAVTLWVPPGATIPDEEREAACERITAAAAELAPGARGEVMFPVELELRKNSDEGRYMSVVGGLSPHWARFTDRVFGFYQLDSSAIHRLPEDADKVTQLIDFTVLVANGIRKAGRRAAVKAENAWTVQKLDGLGGPVVVAAAGGGAADGTTVRRTLRAGLAAARATMEAQPAAEREGRAVAFVGMYRSMEEETASAALRGVDPGLFAGLDFACLLADGQFKLLLGPRPGSIVAER